MPYLISLRIWYNVARQKTCDDTSWSEARLYRIVQS